jgi:signal transduction histidine kinase
MYKQALLNIITNAKDAIHENKPDNTDIDISYDKDDTFGIVTIKDHAGGIPEEILSKIFEKNFTTKGENGSGIGLAMTKEIIEDFCHGKLSVENTDDGAKFSIYIPLYER